MTLVQIIKGILNVPLDLFEEGGLMSKNSMILN